ncbi:MAG TPA: hypothetical protein DEQ09_07690 [Bacteroidales bacterium]|nr:hypothetical protein [Bacteroidales bacterium]
MFEPLTDGDEKYRKRREIVFIILSNYVYKMVSALVDSIPFYMGTRFLSRYLNIDPVRDYKVGKKG